MSLVYRVVEDLVDSLLEHIKDTLGDYTRTLKRDLEDFANRLIRDVMKAMAVGIMGIALLSFGSIFLLMGLVTYLTPMVGAAQAWGVVGLGMAGGGGALLLGLRRMMRREKRRSTTRVIVLESRR